jgi:hypothetical protein
VGLFRKYRRGDENDGRENVCQVVIHEGENWFKGNTRCSFEMILLSYLGILQDEP